MKRGKFPSGRGRTQRRNRQQQRRPYPPPSPVFAMPMVPARRGPNRKKTNRQFVPPDAFTVHSSISADYAGGILGRGGNLLKEYREQSGCRIKLSKVVEGEETRDLYFTGKRENVLRAMEMVISNIEEQRARMLEDGDPSYVPGSSDDHTSSSNSAEVVSAPPTLSDEPTTSAPPTLDDSSSAPPNMHGQPDALSEMHRSGSRQTGPGIDGTHEGDSKIEFWLYVENVNVGAVIGSAGQTLKRIRSTTGAMVQVSREFIPGTTMKSIQIVGTKAMLMGALEQIVWELAERHDRIQQLMEKKASSPRVSSPKMKAVNKMPRPPPEMKLPFQTPYYMRTPRPSAPQFGNAYYMSTPKVSGEERKEEDDISAQFGISTRGSNEAKMEHLGDEGEFLDSSFESEDNKSNDVKINGSLEEIPKLDVDDIVGRLKGPELEKKAKAIKEVSHILGKDLRELIDNGVVMRISRLLDPHITEPRLEIILNSLRVLLNILSDGEDEVPNRYARILNEAGICQVVEHLQNHKNQGVYERALAILRHFPNRGRGELFPEHRRIPVDMLPGRG